jgi:hypothetical protein
MHKATRTFRHLVISITKTVDWSSFVGIVRISGETARFTQRAAGENRRTRKGVVAAIIAKAGRVARLRQAYSPGQARFKPGRLAPLPMARANGEVLLQPFSVSENAWRSPGRLFPLC